VDQGANFAECPADAAAAADIVLICVSDTPDVRSILMEEQRGVAAGVSKGSLIIDCSTSSPEATREFAAFFAARDVGFVDAPVSGGSEGAIYGTLAIMCGGSQGDFARAYPVLAVIGGAITHVGESGAGQITKAVNQVIIAGTYQSVAEGLALARKAGADPALVAKAIGGGAAASWVLENRADNMIKGTYPLGFRMRLHRKDLAIAIDTATSAGVSMPLATMVATFEDGLIGDGYGDEDMSALARKVRRESEWS